MRLRLERFINECGRQVVHWFCKRCGERVPVAFNYCPICDIKGCYPRPPFTREEWLGEL